MNFVESFNMFSTESKQIPCVKSSGAPTKATEGAVGLLYMDTDTGDTYKCVSVSDGVYAWTPTNDMVDDETVSNNPWSSKNIIDNICPPFEVSGAVVTCEPIEGYPLSVTASADATKVTRCGKTLLQYPYSMGNRNVSGITITDNGDGSITLNGTCTAQIYHNLKESDGINFAGEYMATGSDGTKLKNGYAFSLVNGNSDIFMCNTGSGVIYISVKKDVTVNNLTVYPQVEYGTAVTEWEPYVGGTFDIETDTPTSPGKNLFNIDAGFTGVNNGKATVKNGVLTVHGQMVNAARISIEPNTTYTLSFKSRRTGERGGGVYVRTYDSSNVATEVLKYKADIINGTYQIITPADAVELEISFYGSNVNTDATNYSVFTEIQLELGDTATEYEPYFGESYREGIEIPALQGVNTIYTDAGYVSVTGRSDYIALLNKLTNTIISLGGNV